MDLDEGQVRSDLTHNRGRLSRPEPEGTSHEPDWPVIVHTYVYARRVGQRRIEREWPQPRSTRHVWVIGDDRLTPPVQGLVLAWSRRAYKWSALVVRLDESGQGTRVIQDWLPLERLRPVRSDPNRVLRYSGFSELNRPPRDERLSSEG